MAKNFAKWVALLLLIAISNSSTAHTYYEGLTDISVNRSKQRTEIIHRLTTHDIEVLLSEKFNQRISADQSSYEQFVRQYVEQHFSLITNKKNIPLEWVGIENGVNETVVYQTKEKLIDLLGIQVKNTLLTELFSEQVNRTNYDDGKTSGTLIFDSQHQSFSIKRDTTKDNTIKP